MPRLIASIFICALLGGCAVGPAPQARGDDLFGRVQAGMTRDQVGALMGRPHNTMDFPRSNTTSWGWFGFDTWGYYTEFSVTFDADARVVSKTARRVDPLTGRD